MPAGLHVVVVDNSDVQNSTVEGSDTEAKDFTYAYDAKRGCAARDGPTAAAPGSRGAAAAQEGRAVVAGRCRPGPAAGRPAVPPTHLRTSTSGGVGGRRRRCLSLGRIMATGLTHHSRRAWPHVDVARR